MPTPTYRNHMSIKQGGKGVPYGGSGVLREDGEANYGFRNLKTNPGDLDSVPELVRDPALRALVVNLNRRNSGFFTVGCMSFDVAEQSGHRRSGYVEFAANSQRLVADASNYFPLFFHFDSFISKAQRRYEVAIDWELMGAAFIDDVRCDGFTCSVFINTFHVASPEEAVKAWDEALGLLVSYFDTWGHAEQDIIYKAPT